MACGELIQAKTYPQAAQAIINLVRRKLIQSKTYLRAVEQIINSRRGKLIHAKTYPRAVSLLINYLIRKNLSEIHAPPQAAREKNQGFRTLGSQKSSFQVSWERISANN